MPRHRRIAGWIVAIALVVAANGGPARAQNPVPSPSPASAADGEALFERVRSVWAERLYPRLVAFVVTIVAGSGSLQRSDSYRGSVQPRTGDLRVHSLTLAEERQPSTPRGINSVYSATIGIASGHRPVGDTHDSASLAHSGSIARERSLAAYAIPELSPTFTFGIRSCVRPDIAPSGDEDGPRTIGRVASVSRRYRATIVDPDTRTEDEGIHLSLVPLIDARRDRLRDLWVDRATLAPVRARVVGNFTDAGDEQTPWLIDFTTVGSATYIAREVAELPIRRGSTVFDRVDIRFDRIEADASLGSDLEFAIAPDLGRLDTIAEPRNEC